METNPEEKVVNQQPEETQQKKKKKKNRNKKKKAQGNNEEANVEEEKKGNEEQQSFNNHEDLLQLLSQNDNVLFEKLLNTTPDFSNFDKIKANFEQRISSMDKTIQDIFEGNFQNIPDEEGFFINILNFINKKRKM